MDDQRIAPLGGSWTVVTNFALDRSLRRVVVDGANSLPVAVSRIRDPYGIDRDNLRDGLGSAHRDQPRRREDQQTGDERGKRENARRKGRRNQIRIVANRARLRREGWRRPDRCDSEAAFNESGQFAGIRIRVDPRQ
jgi:hypothetical protein